MATEFDKTQERFALDFPGSAGVVTLEGLKTGRPFVAVDGVRAGTGMIPKYKIPMKDGTVTEATLRMTLSGKVKVLSGRRTVFSTPGTPAVLLVLSLLPLLLIFIVGGVIGSAIAGALVGLSLGTVRNQGLPMVVRYLTPVGITLVAGGIELAIVAAVQASE
jgi:hypothetical protein